MCRSVMSAVEGRPLDASGPWSFSNYADRAIRTATIGYTGCHTHNRVAGKSGSDCTVDTHMPRSSYTAGTFHTHSDTDGSMLRTRSIRADTRADALFDERPQRSLG